MKKIQFFIFQIILFIGSVPLLFAEDGHDHEGKLGAIHEAIEALKAGSPGAFWGVASILFVYGLLHGVGMAHGGIIVQAWVVASKRKFSNVFIASSMTAVFHALSASVVVFGTWFLLKSTVPVDRLNEIMKFVAGGITISIGAYMLYTFIIAKIKHECVHCHGHGQSDDGNPFLIAFNAGIIPCPVTSGIIVTAIALGLVKQAVWFMLIFMSGMALATTAVSVAVWFIREKTAGDKFRKAGHIIEDILPVLGAAVFIIIGIIVIGSPV
ncbi:MAG TPA: sulfite exporter TauE/SafE family protein [Candidatus Goldiibacteriota bacterium]|nr:sulfite exporter TauE/SafE family protein [Candidatus Goldiibacteriota bacterium]